MKNRRVVVTGGLGFLGSNLAHKLAESGSDEITLIDSLNPMYGGNMFNVDGIKERIRVMVEDIRNLEKVKEPILAADVIFHLAGQVSYIDSLAMPMEDLEMNAGTTLALLELLRKNQRRPRFIFASSRMVIGKAKSYPVLEDHPTNPLSLYGVHKLTAEMHCHIYFRHFGIPTTVLRITNPYGPRQQIKHGKYSLVGWFIRQAMERKTITIFGEGSQERDYIYADDVASAFTSCGSTDTMAGQVYNVGMGHSYRFRDMVRLVIETVGGGRMEHIPWPTNYERLETGDFAVDTSKLRNAIEWNPRIALPEGIKKTFEYYKENWAQYV